ncbi:MAG: SH3 domain-containing protein [Agathobacter sp.]|nr:SH3 domain-containing protein [Agathobacter sp.]
MRKSKHFRKDVIIARIIAALILVVLIALIVSVVSHFKKTWTDNNSQNTQNTQDVNTGNPSIESEDTEEQNSQIQQDTSAEDPVDSELNSEEDPNTDVVEKVYVKTTTRIRLREEPNTNCTTLDRINGGIKLEVLETLEGWYKVSYNGKIGYISADYANVVEE